MSDPEYFVDATRDYYSVLGVVETVGFEQMKRAYKKLAAKNHPDRGGDAEKMKEINEAYDVLSDPESRKYYDQIRTEYIDQDRWNIFEEPVHREPAGPEFLRTRNLKDFIYDSIIYFQERLAMAVPDETAHDFKAAARFVYNTWRHVSARKMAKYINFGGIRVRRNRRISMLQRDSLNE